MVNIPKRRHAAASLAEAGEASPRTAVPLSANKQAFVDDARTEQRVQPMRGRAMRVRLLAQLASRQAHKHGFHVCALNGNSMQLRAHQQAWLDGQLARFSQPQQYVNNHVALMQTDRWRHFRSGLTVLPDVARQTCAALRHFFVDANLDADRLSLRLGIEAQFDAFIAQHAVLRPLFERYFVEETASLTTMAANVGLSRQGHVQAIKRAREDCRRNAITSAYFHAYDDTKPRSNAIADGRAHVDAYLLTPRKMLCLIPFGMDPAIDQGDFPDLYSSSVDAFVSVCGHAQASASGAGGTGEEQRYSPQASHFQCASLALAYVKEYLQYDAMQLRRFTLTAASQDAAGPAVGVPTAGAGAGAGAGAASAVAGSRAARFFLPSPHVLRYSQSSLYIALLRAMVAGRTATQTVQHHGTSHEVTTLAGMAMAGSVIEAVDGTRLTASALEDFRLQWLKVLDDYVLPKRQAMAINTIEVDYRFEDGQQVVSETVVRKNVALDYRHLKYLAMAQDGAVPDDDTGFVLL
ncbi:MAG: hypothetical protein ACRYGK_11735 [Janthinobacterium lividum]